MSTAAGEPYAVAITAYRRHVHSVSVMVVKALSQDDALGKGIRVARKAWPQEDGWCSHNATACPATKIIDPDGAIVFTPK